MKAGDIIAALGGATKLSKEIGVKRSAISNWSRDGIPGRHWPKLARVATHKRLAHITLEVIEAHQRDFGPRKRKPPTWKGKPQRRAANAECEAAA